MDELKVCGRCIEYETWGDGGYGGHLFVCDNPECANYSRKEIDALQSELDDLKQRISEAAGEIEGTNKPDSLIGRV